MNKTQVIPILSKVDNGLTIVTVPLNTILQQTNLSDTFTGQIDLFKTLPDGTLILDPNKIIIDGNNLCWTTISDNDINTEQEIVHVQNNESNEGSGTKLKTAIPSNDTIKSKSKIRYIRSKFFSHQKDELSPVKEVKKVRLIQCRFCEEKFTRLSLYNRHQKMHLDEKKFNCVTCSASFNIRSNYVLHLAIHNTENPSCPECGKRFHRMASLKAHLAYHEKDETFYCEQCDMSFNNEIEMNEHQKEHTNGMRTETDTLLKCKHCSLTFAIQADYKKHLSEHNKMHSMLHIQPRKKPRNQILVQKQFSCTVCKKTFPKRSHIERHMRVHNGEKPYVCEVCERGFSQSGSLQIHMTRHTGIKPHKCTLCPAKFSQKGNLRAHVQKTHSTPSSGQNAFACSECSCVFRTLGSLNGHMTRNHPQHKQQCDDIKSVMSQLTAIQNSISADNDILQQAIIQLELPGVQNVEEEEVTPPQPEVVKELNSTPNPVTTYVTLSDVSLDGTIRRYVIKQQRIGDNNRWYVCTFCPKEFKKPSDLVRHLRVHTREKPFKCKICTRSFALKSTLTAHIRTHTKKRDKETKRVSHKSASNSWSNLNIRVRKHPNQKTYKCNICMKEFRNPVNFKKHFQVHLTKEKQTWYLTNESNPDNNVMQEPIKLISKEVPFKKRPLTDSNSKGRSYKCSVCPAAFRKLSHLKQHHIKHTGERPFRCNLCFRNFTTSGALKAHIKTHNGTKPYKCTLCDKNFSTNGSLRRHLESHSNVKPYMCPYCFKCFKMLFTCRKHIKIHKSELNPGLAPVLIHLQETAAPCSPSDLVDTLEEDDPFGLVAAQNDLIRNEKTNLDETFDTTQLVTHTLQADNNGTVVLPVIANQENLTQENIREIEDTLNNQMLNIIGTNNYTNTSTYTTATTNKIISDEPILTTDELVNTLTDNENIVKPSSATVDNNNPYFYQHVIVNLNADESEIPMFDNVSGIDNILSQVKLQHDPLFLTDLNINDTSNVLLPFQMQQNQQMIMLSSSEIGQESTFGNQNDVDLVNESIDQNVVTNFLQHSANSIQILDDTNEDQISNVVEETQEEARTSVDYENLIDSVEFLCNVCKIPFKSKTDLKMHQCLNFLDINLSKNDQVEKIINNEETQFQENDAPAPLYRNACSYCPKSFRKPSDLQRHIRTHTGERPYKCVSCAKCFSLKSTLEHHMKIHLGTKDCLCTVCNCLFSSKASLNVHMRLHTGIRPYECPMCQLKFRTSGHRKSHLLVHLKEALRTGKIPGDVITRKAKMSEFMNCVQNMLDENLKSNPQQIETESPQTNNTQVVQFEVQTNEHGQVLNIKPSSSNTLTDGTVITEVELNDDIRNQIESFIKRECNVCHKQFSTKFLLERHRKIHTGERVYACTHCTKTFNQKNALDAHVRIHVGSRPYSCPYCSNKFSQSGNLKTHIKRIHSIIRRRI